MTTDNVKFVHHKDGYVTAISFPDEYLLPQGTLAEVPVDLKVGVGDPWPLPQSTEPEPRRVTRKKTE